ncbi:alkaline phosphatase [bacterium]|nr:alkaline phosphatase [bacterium]
MKRLLHLALAALLMLSLPVYAADQNDTVKIADFTQAADAAAIQNVKPVKNIIIMIGDGMGINEVGAARTALYGRGLGLTLDRLPALGQSITWSLSDDFITDSGAGGTALACGLRTLNGRIGEDRDARPLKNILELARSMGKSTGVVVTCSITHATPACFLAHVKNRSNEWEIARQICAAPADVMLGGGIEFFLPASDKRSRRDDETDLLEVLRKRGYSVLTTADELKATDFGKAKAVAGFFAPYNMRSATKRDTPLPDMVAGALQLLSRNPKGFFLMVEGSQIDGGGHGNDLQYVVDETLDFDRAVAKAVDFAEKDGNTLVVVTADHETGGLSLTETNETDGTMTAGWTGPEHTGSVVPLLAYGPNAQAFAGLHHNFHVPQLAVQGWGVKNFASFATDK